MIVLAADYVGLKIVEFLAGRRERIETLVLDAGNRGGYNDRIEKVYRAAGGGQVAGAERLVDREFISDMERRRPALGILAWWPYLLKGPILDAPRHGWLNLHPSYLPFNRGKNPNFWCLADATPCGVSLHYIDTGIDSGDVVARREVPVSWEDTGESIYLRSRDAIIDLFADSFESVRAGRLPGVKQDPHQGSFHRGAEMPAASRIDLDAATTPRRLFNLIRARMFPPHPTATFTDGTKTFSVQVVIREVDEDARG